MRASKHLKKAFMWYKIRELFEKGLNKSQISIEVDIHRKTVRKYLSMSEDEFYKSLDQPRKLPKKLNDYYDYVRKLLEAPARLKVRSTAERSIALPLGTHLILQIRNKFRRNNMF